MTNSVRIFEMSLRDGLQNEPMVVPTEDKLAFLRQLVGAGFTDIEVASFVRPRWAPQMADAAKVVAGLPDAAGVRFWGLVPNRVGLERALQAGLTHLATVVSASETHNQRNLNRTIRESMQMLGQVIAQGVDEGAELRAYISTAFGCPFDGQVPVSGPVRQAVALLDAGATSVVLGDTVGLADPEQVKRMLEALDTAGVGRSQIGLHLHDTRGTALASAYAAWQDGVRMFDGSLAGIGGCPYAPGAAGNVATEELIYLFHRLGCSTGVKLDGAADAGLFMEQVLGRPLPGRYHQYWESQCRDAMESGVGS